MLSQSGGSPTSSLQDRAMLTVWAAQGYTSFQMHERRAEVKCTRPLQQSAQVPSRYHSRDLLAHNAGHLWKAFQDPESSRHPSRTVQGNSNSGWVIRGSRKDSEDCMIGVVLEETAVASCEASSNQVSLTPPVSVKFSASELRCSRGTKIT